MQCLIIYLFIYYTFLATSYRIVKAADWLSALLFIRSLSLYARYRHCTNKLHGIPSLKMTEGFILKR